VPERGPSGREWDPDDRSGWARDPEDGPVIVGLDHVLLSMPPGGEDAARAFYSKLLGLSEIPKPPPLDTHGGCWFLGHAGLPGVVAGVAIHLGVEEPFHPARKAHVALLVDDLRALRVLLAGAGVDVRDDDADIGVRRFYAFDPFGNRLEMVDSRDVGFSARGRYSSRTETPPEGAFAIEATFRMDPLADPAAIGAAITVELCGHWTHDPPCRWPHHTVAEDVRPGRVRTRTVVVAVKDASELERRIATVLAAGQWPGVEGSWELLEMERVPLRWDEFELANMINPSGAHWGPPDD
jgi:catechol 2,3-dioxygenase-like lactoylglutathione lyase family enzyme